MKILSVNAGSSSLKFNLIELPEEKELISGYFEKIGLEDSFYSIKMNGEKTKKTASIKDHAEAIKYLIDELIGNKVIASLEEIDGVGHRLVHGGDKYNKSVIIDDDVIKTVSELSSLAPLHNPANIVGVKAFREAMPNTPMVGVFDTAFHQTMEEKEYLYPVPMDWYRNYGVRKYGFHGTSHKYITKKVQEMLGKENVNIISCHVGSGGSLCCIKDGKSIDTTMGFSPNAGIMMGTRSGDIDYSMIPYLMQKTDMTIAEIDNALNKQSGLLAISGKYSDHRDIETGMAEGDEASILANDMYVDKIVSYIARYYVKLDGKVDALVFTAGLGENAREFREEVVNKLGSLRMYIDKEENNKIASYLDKSEGKISNDESETPIYVIPTNEELMIALDTMELIS